MHFLSRHLCCPSQFCLPMWWLKVTWWPLSLWPLHNQSVSGVSFSSLICDITVPSESSSHDLVLFFLACGFLHSWFSVTGSFFFFLWTSETWCFSTALLPGCSFYIAHMIARKFRPCSGFPKAALRFYGQGQIFPLGRVSDSVWPQEYWHIAYLDISGEVCTSSLWRNDGQWSFACHEWGSWVLAPALPNKTTLIDG